MEDNKNILGWKTTWRKFSQEEIEEIRNRPFLLFDENLKAKVIDNSVLGTDEEAEEWSKNYEAKKAHLNNIN
jgi:hypothetical protein